MAVSTAGPYVAGVPTTLPFHQQVEFIPNSRLVSKTLCPDTEQVPTSLVDVRGWAVEDSVLEWVAPTRRVTDADARCLGRPLDPVPTPRPSASTPFRCRVRDGCRFVVAGR